MKLTMLGTGNALVTKCYNTCFVLEDDKKYFLVDGGGGNTVLSNLEKAGIDLMQIHEIFVTHKHIDHVLGIVWIIRIICQNMLKGKYQGEANVYAHAELIEIIKTLTSMLLQAKQTKLIGERVHLIPVADGEAKTIIGHKVQFFDIHSTKAKQFGFTFQLDTREKLTCCGDEPYSEYEHDYAVESKWLLHEAFCLFGQADIFNPYEKNHSTVKDACQLAAKLDVKNLVLYHTEDKNLANRKQLYTTEGRQYYTGNLFVPEDLETIEL